MDDGPVAAAKVHGRDQLVAIMWYKLTDSDHVL